MTGQTPLRVILVGCGFWGGSWAQVIRESPGWELVAAVDSDENARRVAAARLGLNVDRCFPSVSEASEGVEADAALVVVPPEAHKPVALEALAANLHCLIEKPLATSVADAQAIVDDGARRRRVVMVSQQYRYRPPTQAIRRIVEEGRIGSIAAATVRFYGLAPESSLRLKTDNPLILDMAIHHFDLIRGILKLEPRAVVARSYNPVGSPFAKGGAASAIVETHSGAVVTYAGNWAAGARLTGWEGAWDVLGEKGSIHWSGGVVTLRAGPVPLSSKIRRRILHEPFPGTRMRLPKLDETDRARSLGVFRRAIVDGEEPETSGRDNIHSLALTLAALESARSGRRVEVMSG